MSERKMSKKELLDAIAKLEKNPHDRIKILGGLGIAGIGAGAAGTAAAVVGSTSVAIPIITTLTGATLMTAAAPVTLVAGAAIAGAAASYGLAQLAFGGAFQEGKRSEIKKTLLEKLRETEAKERKGGLTDLDKASFTIFLKEPIKSGLITAEQAQTLIELVEAGKMSIQEAYRHLHTLISDERGLPGS